MQSRVRILGHPLHPMLVAFPVASYVFTFAALVAYAVTMQPFWYGVALVANVVGVAGAALAAIPGAIDLLTVVPVNTVARKTGVTHALLNVGALVLFAITLAVLAMEAGTQRPPVPVVGMLLSGIG